MQSCIATSSPKSLAVSGRDCTIRITAIEGPISVRTWTHPSDVFPIKLSESRDFYGDPSNLFVTADEPTQFSWELLP